MHDATNDNGDSARWLTLIRVSNRELFRSVVVRTYRDAHGNLTRTAERLHVSRRTVTTWRRDDDDLKRATPAKRGRPGPSAPAAAAIKVPFTPFAVTSTAKPILNPAAFLEAVVRTRPDGSDEFAVMWSRPGRRSFLEIGLDARHCDVVGGEWATCCFVPVEFAAALALRLARDGWTITPKAFEHAAHG